MHSEINSMLECRLKVPCLQCIDGPHVFTEELLMISHKLVESQLAAAMPRRGTRRRTTSVDYSVTMGTHLISSSVISSTQRRRQTAGCKISTRPTLSEDRQRIRLG